jgi:hypothetical protein
MAIDNKAWRQGEFVPPGAEPGLTRGFAWRNAIEAREVAQIARQRFAYPNDAEPTLRTYTNVPERTLGIRDDTGALLFPDIVVVDGRTTEVKLLGEVETTRSLNEEADLEEKWRTFASLGPLYLFVPMALLDSARRRLKKAGVRLAGLRAWRYMAGMDFTDIVDVRL